MTARTDRLSQYPIITTPRSGKLISITPEDAERFESRINKNGPEVVQKEVLNKYPDLKGTRCHIWTAGKSSAGYGIFTFNIGLGSYMPVHIGAHVVAFALYVGHLENECCHKCDNPICVNPLHLFNGNAKDNAIDRADKGRNANQNGEANHAALLTEEDVRYIRQNYRLIHKKLGNGPELAKLFGISQPLVSMIVNRKRWNHVI
jgi:hypothetical protein